MPYILNANIMYRLFCHIFYSIKHDEHFFLRCQTLFCNNILNYCIAFHCMDIEQFI